MMFIHVSVPLLEEGPGRDSGLFGQLPLGMGTNVWDAALGQSLPAGHISIFSAPPPPPALRFLGERVFSLLPPWGPGEVGIVAIAFQGERWAERVKAPETTPPSRVCGGITSTHSPRCRASAHAQLQWWCLCNCERHGGGFWPWGCPRGCAKDDLGGSGGDCFSLSHSTLPGSSWS